MPAITRTLSSIITEVSSRSPAGRAGVARPADRRGASLTIAAALALASACGPKPDPGDTASGTTGAEDTGDVPTTSGEPTSGVPADCPQGQDPLTPLWTAEYQAPPDSFGFSSGQGPFARLADGRIVVAMDFQPSVDEAGLALLLTAADGAVIGPQTATVGDSNVEVHVLRIDSADRPVVLAEHYDGGDGPELRLTRFAADMSLLAELPLEFPAAGVDHRPAMVLDGDTPVVAGLDDESGLAHVARLAADTGVPEWKVQLTDDGLVLARQVAVGPDGSVAVAGHGAPDLDDPDTLHLWRFTADGAPLWRRDLTVPSYEDITALHFAPDEQLVVLRGTREFSTRVELLSVEVADGATRWERTVAEPEGDMSAWAQDLLIDGDRLTIPVTRSIAHHDISTTHHSLEIRTVSLSGELLDVVTLPGVLDGESTSWVRSVRGRCGELILLESYEQLRLFAFAP